MGKPHADRTEMPRGIRRWDLVACGINIVIGAGIFGLPAKIFSNAGSLSALAYLVCGIGVLLIVLCFAEISSRFTQVGGPYLYTGIAFGPLIGFQVGWLRWLSGTVTFAANSNLLVDYLGVFWPPVAAGTLRYVAVSAVVLTLALVNTIGVRSAAFTGNVFAIGKLLPLILFVVAGVAFVDPHRLALGSLPTYDGFSTSVMLVMYAFMGFEAITVPASEVRDPQRNMPFALFVSMGFIALLFVSIQIVCMGTLPTLAESTRPLADASGQFFGSMGSYVIAGGAVLSIAGQLVVQLLAISRLLFAMSEQQQLPQIVASVHLRFRTPYVAISMTAMVILALALSGSFLQLATLGVVSRLVIYAITCASLPVLRRRSGVAAAKFELQYGVSIAVAAVALCLWLLSNSTLKEIGAVAIASGLGLVICASQVFRRTYSDSALR